MACKGIVAAVVRRNGHDGTCTIASQYVVANPDGYLVARKGVDGIASAEYTTHAAVADSFAFGTLLGALQVSLHGLFLAGGSHLSHQFAFRSQHHEGHAKHRVGTGGEDGELQVAIFHLELHFGTFGASNPVALCLLE